MRALIQRVNHASVSIDHGVTSSIDQGLLVFIGIEVNDSEEDIAWLCGKILRLRIFNDPGGLMNLSVQEIQGNILVISQFTLHASTRKGNRPSFIRAANPEVAIPIYNRFIQVLEKEYGKKIKSGKFGAHMLISLVNNGPVTIYIDTKNKE